MNKILITILSGAMLASSCTENSTVLKSPDGEITVDFSLDSEGRPSYSVVFQNETIVAPSAMGFELKGQSPMLAGFRVDRVERISADSTWTPVWGENAEIISKYNGMTVCMTQTAGDAERRLNIEFRAYDDGIGFRYIFPDQATREFVITDELSEMKMGGDYTAWWIPGDYDTQEYEYTRSKLSEIRALVEKDHMSNVSSSRFSPTGVQTSLMMKTPSGKYVNIHEAALVNYPAMHLNLNDTTLTFVSHLTPMPDGTKAVVDVPFRTPWRVVMLGDRATDILATDIIYNLNDPCALDSTVWIKPVKYMGVWWEMITGKSEWSYTDAENFDLATFDYAKAKPHGRHGANNENVRRYIDFAAENGFDQLLIEGWNIGWEDWFGKEKDYVFDFQTPYPDFDLDSLNAYARSKGIRLMMHHETSGSIPNYDKYMDAAYDLMNRYGYNAVKSGYVGNILPKGNNHYNQTAVNHYLNAVRKAAAHRIMVNAHEAVHPTGLARTYPNLIGNESAMGTEYQNMSPEHVTILPFTRLKGGPMDFTPGVFRMDLGSFAPGNPNHKKATVANQLALYVTMYSPVQMACDMPEHYAEKPDAFRFIKDVPVDWSESRYIDAEPGEFIIAARRDKNSDNWFAGGVAASQGKDYNLVLDFLEPGATYAATIYADAPDADCITNPESYVIMTKEVTATDVIPVHMARGGGFAISFIKK